ncbi:cardiolipin synthase [Oscillatoria amoena NRMC-F 0135]|nr:cardiolipin synthase [Oscillatoria amoena NRMC-F 0135]
MRRRPVGVSLAWLSVIFLVPYIGILLYLLIGEVRLAEKRARMTSRVLRPFTEWLRSLKPRHPDVIAALSPMSRSLLNQAYRMTGFPALTGNRIELLGGADEVFPRLIGDIRAAQSCCNLQFYIFVPGGKVDGIVEALADAVTRGVKCRLLVDSLGSADFLKSDAPGKLRARGIEVTEALHANFFRALFWRQDVRNHRKIVTIDEQIAYTGSLNMADPATFKADAGVGHWVDAMVRIEGPAVESLEGVFLGDWEIEHGDDGVRAEYGLQSNIPDCGDQIIQTIPSGPDQAHKAIHDVLISSMYSSVRELVVTTPYFVPSETMLEALCSASLRGVNVTLIVPARNDSRMVFHASRSNYDDLMAAGVRIAEFDGGLLHTKSVAIDGEVCLFGSVNLDQRSFWINFEVTQLVFDRGFTEQIRRLQDTYLKDSKLIDPEQWKKRPFRKRLVDNTFRLMGPLL